MPSLLKAAEIFQFLFVYLLIFPGYPISESTWGSCPRCSGCEMVNVGPVAFSSRCWEWWHLVVTNDNGLQTLQLMLLLRTRLPMHLSQMNVFCHSESTQYGREMDFFFPRNHFKDSYYLNTHTQKRTRKFSNVSLKW